MSTKTSAIPKRWRPADDPNWAPDGPLLALVIIQNVLGELKRTTSAYVGGEWQDDGRYVGGSWDKPGVLCWMPYNVGIFEPPPLELMDRKWLHKMWPSL